MKFTVREPVGCDRETFWRVFGSAEYVAEAGPPGTIEAEVVAQEGELPGPFSRTVRFVTEMDAPGPVKKVVGQTTTTTDVGSYDPAAGVYTYTVTPSTLSDKIKISGRLWAEERPDGTVEKVNEVDVTVKVFGIGGLFEKTIENQTRAADKRSAAAITRLASDRGLP